MEQKPDGLRNSTQADAPKVEPSTESNDNDAVLENRVPIQQTDTRLEHLRY